jgi:CDP-glucose 4,6-dehydratase
MLLGKHGNNFIMELNELYFRKKVFVTGHTGFKGSWLVSVLSKLGAIVRGYALPADDPDALFNLIGGEQICESVFGDIRDKENFKKQIVDFQPDFIFHLAAQPLVRLSYKSPLETFEVNAIGTVNLLEAVKEIARPISVVIITTDKVYYNNEWTYPYRENDRLGGFDPYSCSKACAELIVDCYRNSFFNANSFSSHGKVIATARAGNVIGGGDRAKDRIIPDIIRSVETGNKLYIRNPYSIRPWQHVLESVYGYLLLGAKMKSDISLGTAWNFGPNQEDALTVQNIVQLAKGKCGDIDVLYESDKNSFHETKTLKLDISKSLQELSWKPRWNSSIAIEQTFDWYHKSKKENPRELVFKQIENYFNS